MCALTTNTSYIPPTTFEAILPPHTIAG